ncbi:MAG: beta-lactamase family protein [Bacteroidales bacterium]|nr:beta-lactamase family protein [Bacteroidales bacterium]
MKKFFFLMLAANISLLSFCQDITKQLKTIKEKHTAVGLTVNIINKGKLIYSFSDGLRDIERNLPLTENTSFRIASVSKMVTVTAIMQLYDQGLFKLNDDVSPFIGFELRNPAFPEIPVTFAMLMSHTSGLRDGTGYDSFLSASYRQKPYP